MIIDSSVSTGGPALAPVWVIRSKSTRLSGLPGEPEGSPAAAAQNRSPFRRYAVAILSFTLSLLVRLALSSVLSLTVPYITFFPGIMVSAWFGGLGPGLVTTGLSALASLYFFAGPLSSSRAISKTDLAGQAVFLAAGAVISWLNEALHQARQRAESELLARRQSEAAIRESEERYRVMAEAASDGMITIDEHSTILFANDAAARMFGYTLASP